MWLWWRCPNDADLWRHMASDSRRLQQHVAKCERCRRRSARFRSFERLLAAERDGQPPEVDEATRSRLIRRAVEQSRELRAK